MEYRLMNCLPFEYRMETKKSVNGEAENQEEECARSDTPSSEASTSGVCSMASSDFESCTEDKQLDRELAVRYLDRDILDLCANVYPFGLYQTTSVPEMNMSNYWERRSIYHRLGPFGDSDEFDYEKCYDCDFHETIPKKQSLVK